MTNLPAGNYMLVIFPFSSITHGFQYDSAVAVNVHVVASAAPAPALAPAPAPAAPAASPTPTRHADTDHDDTDHNDFAGAYRDGRQELRVLQWNTHHGGYGTDNVYSPDRLATWVANMNPDVVMFNEIEKYDRWGNEDQPEVYKALLQQKTGRTWYYVLRAGVRRLVARTARAT